MSKPKHVIVLDHDRMQRAKTAMLTHAITSDQYRVGTLWRSMTDEWEHGKRVDEVNHFGRHTTAAGDELIVERIDGAPIAHVQVIDIHMANTAQLSEADISALGCGSRTEFEADWARAFAGRVWLMKIARVSPRTNTNSGVL